MMYARNSARNVLSHLRQWAIFCVHHSKTMVPAEVTTLVAFLELMARSSGYGHIKAVVSSIKFLHGALDSPFPSDAFQLDATLRGLKRRLARTPFQVLPITPDILRRMYRHVNISNPAQLATWCAFLVAFYCLFRKASVVPESSASKTLPRQAIRLDSETRTVLIYVSHSKTIQFGQRDLVIPLVANSDSALDPWRHLQALLHTCPVSAESPAFSYRHNRCVTYSSFTASLKNLLTLAGLDPQLYSGHSFRRGGATFLHQAGGNVLQVQAAGDWSSMCFTRYLYLSLEQRLASQRLMQASINASTTNSNNTN